MVYIYLFCIYMRFKKKKRENMANKRKLPLNLDIFFFVHIPLIKLYMDGLQLSTFILCILHDHWD